MLNTIKTLGLYEYYDNKGYNVLEIPTKDYDYNIELSIAVLTFLIEYPNLYVKVVDEYGNACEDKEDKEDKNCFYIIYDPKEWELNNIE